MPVNLGGLKSAPELLHADQTAIESGELFVVLPEAIAGK
jgi:hypothetical protein